MLVEVAASCYCSVPELLIYIFLCGVKALTLIDNFYSMSHRKLYSPLIQGTYGTNVQVYN